MLEVGATCVGGIIHTHVPGQYASKGTEKGYFRFGGSMLITIFPPASVRLEQDLLDNTRRGRELYARVGSPLGQWVRRA